ncbi:MAG: DUF3078 domain-containing protein [Calditrichae bacterium]|nr:DUF3078 domain-containing protein [Calditrichia bacterium]
MRIANFILVIAVIFFIQVSLSWAQEDEKELKIGWNNKAVGTLNFTQASFDNWAAGGENSWAWIFNLTGNFLRNQEKSKWNNFYKLEYGRGKVGDSEAKKSADEIFLESEYSHFFRPIWAGYIAVNGRTQFAEGFDFTTDPKTLTSKFLNPGYFRQSAGFKFDPSKKFSTRAGLSLKQTVVTDAMFAPLYTDDLDTYEVEKLRSEIGLESVTVVTYQVKENIIYVSFFDLFSNLKAINEIDVRWDNLLTAEVAKYITVSFNFQLYYDRDISIQRQLKQYLAVGVSYSIL